MRQCGVDALIASSPVNINYFTDYYCWLDRWFRDYMSSPGGPSHLTEMFALLPLEGRPALVLNPVFAANAADIWVQDILTFGDPGLEFSHGESTEGKMFADQLLAGSRFASAFEALGNCLRTRKLDEAVIGIEIESMRPATIARLHDAFPRAQFRDCSNLIRVIRMVKSTEEISRLTRAAEISEIAGLEALSLAHPGTPISEIALHYRKRLTDSGAEPDHFAFSPRGRGIATDAHYTLGSRDAMYIDFGCIYGHYFSDTGITLALGPLPEGLGKRHDALLSSIAAGIAALRPGTLSSAVRAAMWTEFRSHGFEAAFPHGHGLGLEPREYPLLVDNNSLPLMDECINLPSDLPIEEGMVINLEAGMFVLDEGSLQFERTFVIGAGGCRPLIHQFRDTPFQPGINTG